jgi:hypothetical protein
MIRRDLYRGRAQRYEILSSAIVSAGMSVFDAILGSVTSSPIKSMEGHCGGGQRRDRAASEAPAR